ncbi:MAG: TDP-N-acetylfucosamine:lipid II N-acetylfucosaminyltransferase [Candidatus Competibacter sp.]
MKILHIAPDDKFIPFIQDAFDAVWSGCNKFVIFRNKSTERWKFVRSNENTTVGSIYYFLSNLLKKDLAWCDILIIHFMTDLSAYAIKEAPFNLPVIWSGWGADYYKLIISSEEDLLLSETKKIINKMKNNQENKTEFWGKYSQRVRKTIRNFLFYKKELDILNRIDYFSSPIPQDYELLKQAIPELRTNYIQLNYGSIEKTFLAGIDLDKFYKPRGKDILVGNSATSANNHIDAFELLRNINIGEAKIIVPLSYGNEDYKIKIIEIGKNIFGEKFVPLIDFLPLDKYNSIVLNCSVALMNHRRQQGLGNILSSMYGGARLLLREENPIFSYIKQRGGIVDSIEKLSKDNCKLDKSLTPEEIIRNKEFVERDWSHCVVLENIRKLSFLTPRQI